MRLEIEVPDDAAEDWRVCPTYPLYEASNLGRVRRKGNARLIAQRLNKQGYAVVTLSMQRHIQVRFVHILVMDAFLGPKPADHFVQHVDGNKLNNVLNNLRYSRGYSYSGAPAPNVALSSASYSPPDKPWAITEQGFPRFHSESFEGLIAMGQEFLDDLRKETVQPDDGSHPLSEELRAISATDYPNVAPEFDQRPERYVDDPQEEGAVLSLLDFEED